MLTNYTQYITIIQYDLWTYQLQFLLFIKFMLKWTRECMPGFHRYDHREEFTWKKCKTAILLYCFHTAGVLHIFMIYNLLGPGISFYRKSKINIKRKSNYEIGWLNKSLNLTLYCICCKIKNFWFWELEKLRNR